MEIPLVKFDSSKPDLASLAGAYRSDELDVTYTITVSDSNLANVYRRSNEPDKALATLRQGQAIIERLTKLAPDNADWKADLAWFNDQVAALMR